jgi:hypothetical protein
MTWKNVVGAGISVWWWGAHQNRPLERVSGGRVIYDDRTGYRLRPHRIAVRSVVGF